MTEMTDPHQSLLSLQEHVSNGTVILKHCPIHQHLLYFDYNPPGEDYSRTYCLLDEETVIAILAYTFLPPCNEVPVIQIGYAVNEKSRGTGKAKEIIGLVLEELQAELDGTDLQSLYVEAVVGIENISSQHVAAKMLSTNPKPCKDALSDSDALHFRKLLKRANNVAE